MCLWIHFVLLSSVVSSFSHTCFEEYIPLSCSEHALYASFHSFVTCVFLLHNIILDQGITIFLTFLQSIFPSLLSLYFKPCLSDVLLSSCPSFIMPEHNMNTQTSESMILEQFYACVKTCSHTRMITYLIALSHSLFS